MSAGTELRRMLAEDRLLVAPGAYDCITARLIGRAGFRAVYMTGAGTSASLGFPDYGLVTMSEMVDNARRIAGVVQIPVIADADTGYGNELNAVRTVQAYGWAGVAGVHIEDQTFPKRCGHLAGKEVVPRADYLAKIRAAAGERPDPDFVIIARTDARAVLGFEEAIERANRSLEAGADVAFVEAPESMEEVEAVPRLVNGPCLLNVVRRGRTPDLDLRDVERFGYRLAILPGLLLATMLSSGTEVLEELKESHRHPVQRQDFDVRERFGLLGAPEWDAVAERYGKAAEERAAR
ncbi:MAG: carboxyvinyl-carboxyphosphonate phosphorylmutase [Candidatus Nephthysia bennettiae]|uniref:Isocitrate lyase/PEP mutase family protein n=1 Tax=Candidatus Nephthysia bennettiae TaxID=3127016 RepID=A0A934N154_9BACT|nr:isocitrate lyase/PEP mutase family protein [Candidatus Dormibacteraeota bacterium]MBJ7613965.1 isocitrate lyase/PEP mutase family protein [Candidatus Dormibacteraeota bacterium]PZR88457.1 MAG: carboxyvinyl-carboxyphosphonate phosphorylmutase [Candidatus Dormibacteraeota bacterium]